MHTKKIPNNKGTEWFSEILRRTFIRQTFTQNKHTQPTLVSIYQQNSSGTIKATEYPKERTEIKYAR
jgi:hypothetical protein